MKQLILEHNQSTGTPLLIGYLPSLFPDASSYKKALSCCTDQGLECLEIGVPCDNPYLDGAVIRQALTQVMVPTPELPALITESIETVTAAHIQSIVMLYNETLNELGVKAFADLCIQAHADAVLVPNITEDNRVLLYESLRESSVEVVSFIGFDKTDQQIEKILTYTTGFVYLQSIKGSTGGQFTATPKAKERLDKVKSMAAPYNLPVALGFGISTSEDVAQATDVGADAVIIGTAFVKATVLSNEEFSSYLKTFSLYLRAERTVCST